MRRKTSETEDRLPTNEDLIRKMSRQRDEDAPEEVARRDANEVAERYRKNLADALSKLTA